MCNPYARLFVHRLRETQRGKCIIYFYGKYMRIALYVLCLSLFLCSMPAMAQKTDGNADVGFGFLIGFPSGDFKSTLDRNGYGIGAHVGYAFGSTPLMAGLNFGFMTYGNERRQVPFSKTIPDVMVDVERNYNIVQGHFLLRIGPNSGLVRPYLDGLIGFNYLYTSTEVQNKGAVNKEIASSVNLDDFTFSAGGGGGIAVCVYDGRAERKAGEDSLAEVLVHVEARYLSGSTAEYLKPGSISISEKGEVLYDKATSRTDMITGRIGVNLIF